MTKFLEKLKDLSSIGIADISASGISALFWFYLANLLSPEEYGELTFFISISSLTSTVSLLGAVHTNIVYTAKKIQIQSTLYLITLSTGAAASIMLFIIFFNLGVSVYVLGLVIFGLATSELLGRKLYKKYSVFVLTERVLKIILGLGFYFWIGENGVLLGMALSYFPYLFGVVRGLTSSKINFNVITERLNFIIPNYLQTLSGSLNGSLDKLLIGPLLGFAILGNYSLGLQFYSLLTIFTTVISKYIVPQDASGNENKKLKKIAILSSVGIAVFGFTIGPVLISSIFPKFDSAQEILQIVSWTLVPTTIVTVYHSKFYGLEKTRLILYSSLIWTGVQVIGIIVLGSIYGVYGISFSLVLGATASAIWSLYANRYLLDRI